MVRIIVGTFIIMASLTVSGVWMLEEQATQGLRSLTFEEVINP